MDDTLHLDTLIERFANIKEKYGDDYPIILYEPAIKCQEKKLLKDLLEGNNSINLFSEFIKAFKFAQSLGVSFLLIVSKHCDEEHLLYNFGVLESTFGRRVFDFEEEALLLSVFRGVSDEIIKSLNLKVYAFCTLLDFVSEAKIKEEEEEVLLMCDIKEIVSQFRQDFTVIWYDPSADAKNKAALEEGIEVEVQEENFYKDFQELLARIKDVTSTPYHLILSGEIKFEAQELIKDIESLKNLLGLYIVCGDDEIQIGKNENIDIEESLEKLIPKIKEGIRTRSKLKNTFPAFATNFDSSDRSGMYKLHYYLRGLINFHNRKQAKEDFIKLARKIYQDKEKELARFEDTYKAYNKAEILWWYTKDSPIYRLINNCLRISSSDSILYCRLILKDLERAIKEQYQEKSKDFSGVVFRGAYISTEEWEKLERNIGEEIEMYGFLSTTVNQRIAVNFLRADPRNKIFIKIIIPPFLESNEQGFADISEFSHLKEDEILFNIRSRFKIVEAGVTKIDNRGTRCRHLVLLYGAELLRRYITNHKPSIKIELELPPEIKCSQCGSKDKLFGFKQEETSVKCLECLVTVSMPQDTPLIALDTKDGGRVVKTLQGKILASKDKIPFANSGYKCHHCQAKGKNQYYKWMSCDGKNVSVECSDCFLKNKEIANEVLLSEGSPYTIWQEQQKQWETINSDYQGVLSQRIENESQGQVDLEVQNYDRCLDFGQKVLEKFKHQRRREVFKLNSFYILGRTLMRLGKCQQALKYFAKCMNVVRFLGREKDSDGVLLYCQIAEIHYELAEHQEALEYFQQALSIQMSVFGENHLDTIASYHGLALVYDRLGEHQKALECFTKAIDIQKFISGENHPRLAIAYNNLASHYSNLGEYEKALKYYSKSHHLFKSIYGKKHSETAGSYNNLASLYHHLGKYEKAQKCYMKAIDIQKLIHGANHPEVAASYSNLAGLYRRLGRHQEALEYFNKAHGNHKSIYGEKHSETANSLDNIGITYQSVGDFQKALEHFQMALDLRKSIFGEQHTDVAASYNNIAGIEKALGNSQTALEHFQRALNILKHTYSEHHPSIAISYNNLASVYDALGDYQKAVESYSKALVIQEFVYQDKHPDIAMTYSNMGYTYDRLGDHLKAIESYNQALNIQLSVFGKRAPEIAASYNNLGKVYERLGEYLKALDYYQKTLDLQLSFYEEDHPNTLTVYSNIGAVYNSLGKYQEAVELHEKVLNKRIAVFGEMHRDTAMSYYALALAHERLGHYNQALEYNTKALNIRKSIFGESHRETASSYNALASIFFEFENYEIARDYYEKALVINQEILPQKHPKFATSCHNLATTLYRLKDYQQALEYFSKAIDIREEVYGEKHHETASSYDCMGLVYHGLCEYQKSLEYHTKSLKIRESIFKEKHPDIATSYNNLGFLFKTQGDYQMARENFRKAIDIFKPLYGEQHPHTVDVYGSLFDVCKMLKKGEEAIECLQVIRRYQNCAQVNKSTK